MEIRYYGANCIKIASKKCNIVVDDTLKEKTNSPTTDKDIVLKTNKELKYAEGGSFIIQSAGEYEVSEVSVTGIASKLHFDESKTSIIYSIHVGGFSIAIIGHTVGDLSDQQLEKLGVVDILVIPVGGNGYTIDTVAAIKLIKEIEPKIIIPTHYDESGLNYEVPQKSLDEFKKAYGTSDVESLEVLKLKDPSLLSDKTQLVILQKQ
jgi:L-ascorbate metabolism protein UlaG (beta-lactamase superfamily)